MKNCLFLQGGDAFDLEAAIKTHSYDILERLQGEDVKAAHLEELLFSPSFFEKTLVVIEHADDLSERSVELIASFARRPMQGTSLIIQAEKMLPFAKEMTVQVIQEIKPWEKEAKMEEWIASYLKGKGVKAGKEVLSLLASSKVQDRFLMQQELDKLITFSGDLITKEDVYAVGALEHEESVWELVDAFLERDRTRAAMHLRRLLEQHQSPYLLIRSLRNSCHQALMMASLAESGVKNVQEHFPQLRGKIFEKTMRQAEEAGASYLTKQLMKIDKVELALKDSPFDEEALLLKVLL